MSEQIGTDETVDWPSKILTSLDSLNETAAERDRLKAEVERLRGACKAVIDWEEGPEYGWFSSLEPVLDIVRAALAEPKGNN